MKSYREVYVRRILSDVSDFARIPVYLVFAEAYGCRRVSVCKRLRRNVSAAVGIEHKEHPFKFAALNYANRIISVARKRSLQKHAIFRVFKYFALPIVAFSARSFVISHNGRPRYAERFHEVDELDKRRAAVVEFAVNEISRHDDKVGLNGVYRFGYIIET